MRLPAAISSWWINISKPKPLGYLGERAAEKHLKRKGYKIVARGLRSRGGGELDLVAVDGRTVVFVEVKTRRSEQFGHPTEAIDLRKQSRMTRAAVSYLKRHGLLDYRSRFDVVAILWPSGVKRPKIEHYESAFEAIGFDGLYS
jgi:putative endonuclease